MSHTLGIMSFLDGANMQSISQTAKDYWYYCPVVCSAYIVLVFSGKQWMKDKQAYSLRTLLTVWNIGLAALSIWMFVCLLEPFVIAFTSVGIHGAICMPRPLAGERYLAAGVFLLSKILELGDTFFVVLRKTPLNFLHWYHHVTVLSFVWFSYQTMSPGILWYALMNTFVHSFMYSYYFLKGMRVNVPKTVAQAITSLQLVQFVLGMLCLFMALRYNWQGHKCIDTSVIILGYFIYGSYLILFVNFFYQRYFKKKTQ